MKLGTQTGSLTNHVMSRMTIGQPKPVEGMGVTILSWTDRHAGTIINVTQRSSGTIIWVREDKATRTDSNGLSEEQTYTFEPNPQGRVIVFHCAERDGAWREMMLNPSTGRLNIVKGGHGLRIGERAEYRDFSF